MLQTCFLRKSLIPYLIDIIGYKKLDRIYRMEQDKNVEKSMFPYPVNPVNPVKKLFPIKSNSNRFPPDRRPLQIYLKVPQFCHSHGSGNPFLFQLLSISVDFYFHVT